MLEQQSRVVDVVRKLGLSRSRDLVNAGINRKFISIAVQNGDIERIDRGTYALPGFLDRPHARLLAVCTRIPGSVVALLSAAHFHGLIDQEPASVWIAIERKGKRPVSPSIPLRSVRFSGQAMTQGVVNRRIDGIPVRVYSPMKTIADLFKYRNKIGSEMGLEALEASVRTNQYSPYRLLHFARINRVERIAQLYIRQIGSGRQFQGRQTRSLWVQRP